LFNHAIEAGCSIIVYNNYLQSEGICDFIRKCFGYGEIDGASSCMATTLVVVDTLCFFSVEDKPFGRKPLEK